MNEKLDWKYQFTDLRARVYLLWAVLLPVGFAATQYHQEQNINALWFFIAVIGLGYMAATMPLRDKRMRQIFLAWLGPILFGMIISGLVFHQTSHLAASTIQYLGAFWLMVMAVGYTLNGLVDRPSTWYWFAAVLNAAAGLVCYFVHDFTVLQYSVAAVVSAWSMLNLWIFRASEA